MRRRALQSVGKFLLDRLPEIWVASADELVEIAVEHPGAGLSIM